eukprot:TRINITY_DN9530_c0_g1_i3.p1 TRINITY_DN9530_c0_g1~~TRINITY_DN9530_c0_g1_i3.p1  ORF type:complete len:2633 (-),score=502.34 TRINITY_DN9530_c0_g1_i3:271-7929(-)
MPDLSLDVDMKYTSPTGETPADGNGEGNMEFPVTNLYELDSRVFQDNWSIPYKRDESLGKCLVAATKLAAEGLLEQDEHCKKFIERVMPEAFRKLLTSHATHRWQTEIQEGILLMCELYIDLLTTRLQYDPVPCSMLNTLALIFDTKNDWNHKNKDQTPRGRWQENTTGTQSKIEYAKAPESQNTYAREQYGWLCDLVNQYGDKKGFQLIEEKFEKNENLTARAMAALLQPLANCANLLVADTAQLTLSSCMEFAFKFVENLGESELKSKDINYISDLCYSLKVLCCNFWPQHAADCDKSRLEIINRMLRTPHFNCRMNGLKEVSRLIEEAEKARSKHCISQDAVLEWMSLNKVLSVALEGNIDQVQYTDRIKAIVEFLGPRLSSEELTNIWNLGEGENSHVQDNVYGIIAAAASKFSLAQFELLNKLIKGKWLESNDRIREKLLQLIGQIGKEAVNSKQVKPVQAILQLLWEMAHIPEIPKHLVERAFAEHLATINEMTLNKDAIRRQYVLNCVDDIKRTTHCVLPAVKQLYAICKSYSGKGMSMYNKANKATLGELNKQHEIVKLLSTSLNKSHAKGVEVTKKLGLPLKPDSMVDGRYTHKEYVDAHLELMMFLLKEGDLYLSWSRCKELWETLVDNPVSIQMDHDSIFVWFTKCLTDLEPETQKDLFNQKLLSLSPSSTTQKSFSCIKAYFESVNVFDQRLKKSPSPTYVVERTELVGMSYFWDILTETPKEEIANLAIDTVLNMSYLHVTARLKKEPGNLHDKFIKNCYSRLENVCQKSENNHDAVLEGCELETSCSEVKNSLSVNSPISSAVANTTKTLTSISVSKVMGLSLPNKGLKLQKIRRLLLLAEKYILSIEVLFDGKRTILPHAASFFGRPLNIRVKAESPKKDEFELNSHTNESVGDVKARIAERLKVDVAKLSIVSVETRGEEDEVTLEDGKGPDGRLVYQVGNSEGQQWIVKASGNSSSSSTAVVVYDGEGSSTNASSAGASTSSAGASSSFCQEKMSSGRQAFELEQERSLPGVIMAEDGKIFSILYQLAEMDDSATIAGIRRLIHLIPTDSDISDNLDSVGYTSPPAAAADASPKMSPRINKKMRLPKSEDTLEKSFDASAPGMCPFRVLYNLEVLSSRIMPNNSIISSNANRFGEDFVKSGGLRILLNVLEKDALPLDIDYDIRQSAYFIALQLAGYLLCGQMVITNDNVPFSNPISSPMVKPTPAKKSALDSTTDVCKSPLVLSASKFVQTMSEAEFVDLISCLMRVVWAAAAGKLYLAAMGIQAAPKPEKVYIGRRSRDSSTGSSGSTGSDTSSVDQSLHAGVCAQQSNISSIDCQIAGEALELFVTCLSLRQNLIARFYDLPSVSDFIIDTLLGSPSEIVRQQAADQFARLSKIKLVSRALSMSGETTSSSNSPRHFLITILLKTPVPLWMPSCKARTSSHQMTSQCGQYFDLRCRLLQGMSLVEQDILQANSVQMIEDEITWLFNFSPCNKTNDSTLLAGHIKLVKSLLSCQGVNKKEVGSSIISQFITTYLFPASKLISEGGLANNLPSKDISPQCDTPEARAAGYALLIELAKECSDNLKLISKELISLHHQYDANMVKEHQFEYEPAIERRSSSNFVGLKNAGATCYMNSVIQQLYTVPGVTEQILGVEIENIDEETVFYQLQSVFGHLLESKLQYYVPEKFWKCFKLWGQPVNVREQQDAFEFFTQIVDQVDEYLHSEKKEKIFSKKFEGVFSDQKICEGCPHRYEREQTFMALNLTVKSNNLQESLAQFVKGELLEGDNAYFCEKCSIKRNTTKRMCIRSLPQTLVIQLKRFHYDWETNRALKFDDFFEFPWVLDMGPYTAEGISAQEDRDNFQSKLSPGLNLNTSLKDVTNNYDLVGVTVHSGQANAGHYYSFIKDRRGNSVTNANKNKWFKFNDTTVEGFEMTDENLEAECFGGKFKVKKKEGSSLPEERQRYWNGYILVYEARNDHKTPRTPKKSFSGTSHRRSVGPGMVRRLTMPPRISEPGGANQARESLSQLSDLLEKGEKRGIFTSRMPAPIERSIREDNLRFMQNRDVFSEDYYKFMYELTTANTYKHRSSDYKELCRESVNLAIQFLFNTYFHVRRRQRCVMADWVDAIEAVITVCPTASEWLVNYLSSDGLRYLKPYLLESSSRDVRQNFSQLLEKTLSSHIKHSGSSESNAVTGIVTHLVEMLVRDVPDNVKFSSQYFWSLLMFAQMGPPQCKQLFKLGTFEACFQFLTGVPLLETAEEGDKNKQKQWTASQTREFGDLHALLAYLIQSCDTKPFMSHNTVEERVPSTSTFPSTELEKMPTQVSTLLYGPLASLYISETISACREMNSSLSLIIEMLAQVSFCCKSFSILVLEELMKQYNSVSSSELKNLSTLLVELLCISDPLQNDRLKFVIEGTKDLGVDGLLDLVQNNQNSDSCRAYQAVKCLVTASSKCSAVKDHLILEPTKWQWAVNWLKSKMSESSYWSPSTDSVLSNEDSSTRTFQRTTSAQVTLDEANAILAEFESDKDTAMDTNNDTDESQMKVDEKDWDLDSIDP